MGIIILSSLKIYIPDILPDKGVSVAALVNWWTSTLVAQYFPILETEFGISRCFLMFSFICLFGIFFIMKFVPGAPKKGYEMLWDPETSDTTYSIVKDSEIPSMTTTKLLNN